MNNEASEFRNKITSCDITKAISRRHKNDLFFTEVKDGATVTRSHHSRIDALAITRSWTNYCITGYEVKVSRSDFLRDKKWRAYLPMCNQLYWAAPPGIIHPDETPENCGLVQLTPKGGLRTIKKAPYRRIEPPVEMYKYLLFSYAATNRRATGRSEELDVIKRAEKYKEYLDGRRELKRIGRELRGKIGEEIREIRRKAESADYYSGELDSTREKIIKIYAALGMPYYEYESALKVIAEIERLKQNGGA